MVLRGRDVKEVLRREMQTAKIAAQVWLMTQMGHVLRREETKLTQERDERVGKKRARYLAPAISSCIREKFKDEPDRMEQDDKVREVAERQLRDQEHGKDRFRKKGINMHKLGEAFAGEVFTVRKGTNK